MKDLDVLIRISPENYHNMLKQAEERGYEKGFDRAYQLGKEMLELHEKTASKSVEGLIHKYIDLFMSRGK